MTRYDAGYLEALKKEATRVNSLGSSSGYWAGKVMALINLLTAERAASKEEFNRGYRAACDDWGIKPGM